MNGFSLVFHPGRRFQSLTDVLTDRAQQLNGRPLKPYLSLVDQWYMCYSYHNRYCRSVFGERWWEQIVSNLLAESVAALTVFISFSAGVVGKYLHLGISSNGSFLFCGSFDWSTVLTKKSEVLRLRRSFSSDQLQWAELSTIRLSHLCTGISRFEYLSCEWGMIWKMFE